MQELLCGLGGEATADGQTRLALLHDELMAERRTLALVLQAVKESCLHRGFGSVG